MEPSWLVCIDTCQFWCNLASFSFKDSWPCEEHVLQDIKNQVLNWLFRDKTCVLYPVHRVYSNFLKRFKRFFFVELGYIQKKLYIYYTKKNYVSFDLVVSTLIMVFSGQISLLLTFFAL